MYIIFGVLEAGNAGGGRAVPRSRIYLSMVGGPGALLASEDYLEVQMLAQ